MLTPGDLAPDFSLPDQNGDQVRLSGFRDRGHVVLFFYPRDGTPVCTMEVRAFRDAHPAISELDAVVLGVSGDTISTHRRTIDRWGLPFSLLTDAGGEVRRAFRVGRILGTLPARVTYVIDRAGIVRGAFSDPLRAGAHVRSVLRALRATGAGG